MAFENDPEGRKMAEYYAGKDFDKSKTVWVELLREYSGEWTLAEFSELINSAMASVPEDCKHSAKVEMETGECAKLSIGYRGPESASVVAYRIKQCEEYVAETRRSERRQFERLKRKFGT